jgi:hypothetical protein
MGSDSLESALDQKARRSARRIGWVARKSRREHPLENFDGYMIVDPRTNIPVAGFQYDLTAEDVIERCTAE